MAEMHDSLKPKLHAGQSSKIEVISKSGYNRSMIEKIPAFYLRCIFCEGDMFKSDSHSSHFSCEGEKMILVEGKLVRSGKHPLYTVISQFDTPDGKLMAQAQDDKITS